ncbi:hypothetical protein JOD55_000397 [Arcanobacterium pluranimalium]|uniref:type I-E CRISPR-associated protein Cse1/CasA n=1 Tax=Arcanobacterium pluranimalium TaxID=108028 RepID=UPI0019561292|nr:type I-E CRISPR-associated protein Cse1/CasA [Arcanobacterium pluranimalium]MBM7824570.1 hypothetical protein [Arcanobacterium pluranimalium]
MEDQNIFDIPWIDTNRGYLSPRELLKQAHTAGISLNFARPAFEVSTQFRFLLHTIAVVLRHEYTDGKISRSTTENLLKNGLSNKAIDSGLEKLAPGAMLHDGVMPFMQRPPLPPKGPKDTSRKLGPSDQEVKKLSPAMPSDEGEDFWNLLVDFPKSLPYPQAILKLTAYNFFSPAGNNVYDGDKARMGTPGMRFLGKGNAATEFIWQIDGGSLLHSLLASLPKDWVAGDALPAWADREGTSAIADSGLCHPLWAASWSSNVAVGFWENDELTGVRIGGVPQNWILKEVMGNSDELNKNWWDTRNTADPMYLYIRNDQNELKAQRIDLGRDATDLAVEWAAQNKTEHLFATTSKHVLNLEIGDATPLFFRHQIEGTASSPSIRASEVFEADKSLWAFNLDKYVQNDVSNFARLLQDVRNTVVRPFRRKTGNANNVLDALADRANDVSHAFWRNITYTYERFITDVASGNENYQELYENVYYEALRSFDDVTKAYLGQYPNDIFHVRGAVGRYVRKLINDDKANRGLLEN